MLFQMFGNKALVELFVRFPLFSAEQPGAVLSDIARVLQLEDPELQTKPTDICFEQTPKTWSMDR